MPKNVRILVELSYELPVEDGYTTSDGGVTHNPEEMLVEDIKQITDIGLFDFIECVDPDMKILSYSVVD